MRTSFASPGHQKESHSAHREKGVPSSLKRYRRIQSWSQRGQSNDAVTLGGYRHAQRVGPTSRVAGPALAV